MAEQTKAESTEQPGKRPILPFLKLEPTPHLVGSKCRSNAIGVVKTRDGEDRRA